MKVKSYQILLIFFFKEITSEIDAESLKISSVSKNDAFWSDYWTHNILISKSYNTKLDEEKIVKNAYQPPIDDKFNIYLASNHILFY